MPAPRTGSPGQGAGDPSASKQVWTGEKFQGAGDPSWLAPCVTTTLGRRSDQSRRTKRESQGAGDPCASVNPLPIGARCGREPTLIFPGMDQPDRSGSKIRGAKIKSSIFRGCGS